MSSRVTEAARSPGSWMCCYADLTDGPGADIHWRQGVSALAVLSKSAPVTCWQVAIRLS